MLNINRPNPERDPKLNKPAVEPGSMVFGVRKTRIKLDKKRIKSIAKGLSSLAVQMGLTASEEEFATIFEEDFTEALKKVQQRRKDKHTG